MSFFKRGIKSAHRAPVLAATATSSDPKKKETVVVMKPSELTTEAPTYVTRRGDINPNAIQDHPATTVSKGFIQAGLSQVQGSQGFAIERLGIYTDSLR